MPYSKPIKHRDIFAKEDKLPLTDCFVAPCTEGCPIHQDVPEYITFVGEKKYGEALEVISGQKPASFHYRNDLHAQVHGILHEKPL